MAKRTKYEARFADGTVKTRSSARAYTHAWRVRFTHNGYGQTRECEGTGFSSSEALATAAVRSIQNWRQYSNVRSEIVPATIV